VKCASPGLGSDADLSAGATAVLGFVVRSQDLDFLCGIDVGRANACAVRTRARTGRAIEGDEILRVTRAVKVGGTLGQAESEGRARAGTRAGHQRCQAYWVASVEFHRVDLLAGDEFLDSSGLGLESRGAGGNLHGLRGGTDGEGNVDGQVRTGVKLVACGRVALKTLSFDINFVEARRDIGNDEVAGFVGVDDAFDAGLVADRDLGSRYHRPGWIFNVA